MQSSAAALKQIPKGHRVGLMSDLLNEEVARNADKAKPSNGSKRPSPEALPDFPAPTAPSTFPAPAPPPADSTTPEMGSPILQSVSTAREPEATAGTATRAEKAYCTQIVDSQNAPSHAEDAIQRLKNSFEACSIKVLKEKCAEQQLSTLGCTEKSDLVELLLKEDANNRKLGASGSVDVDEPTPDINDID